MKNKFLLVVTSLLATVALVGCDPIQANPSKGDNPLVQIGDKTFFQNNYQKVYDQLVSSGNLTTLTFKKLMNTIIANEVDAEKSFWEDLDTLKQELIDEEMLNKVSSSSYAKDGKFYESKLIDSLRSSLYNIDTDGTHEGIYIKPDTTITEVLGADYCTYKDGKCTGRYAKYVEQEVLSDINQKLLTAKYILENSFASLGRAYARRVSYVKLSNISKQPGAASIALTTWLNDWISEGKTTTDDGKFDLDSLARIWKGLPANDKEKAFIKDNNIYTLKQEINDEVKKIAVVTENENGVLVGDSEGRFPMLADKDTDASLESKYTGSGAYPIEVGYEKALRDLSAKQISDSDLFTKTNGISGLPTGITDRIFSGSVRQYLANPQDTRDVLFLSPATTETSSVLSKYYFYESGEDAYYIVTVDNYDYSSSTLKTKVTYEDDVLVKVNNEVTRIALELSSSSTYKNESLIKVFKKYGLGDEKGYKSENIHDQTFYDYMKTNYPDIFED